MAGVQGGGRRAGAGVRPHRRRACAVAGGATQRPRLPGIPLSGAQRRSAGRGARVPVRELAGRAFHHRSPPGRSERLARGRWLGPRVQAWAGVGRAGGAARARPEDAAAGLAFVVLKTVIAEDDAGVRAMAAWAIHETRMRVERRAAADGRPGWTVTWKGRGWDRTLDEYVALVRAGRDLTRAGGPL